MNQMTRARFLRGDWQKTPLAPSPEAIACIAPSCLAYRDVTCRSCADVCEMVAIFFHPQVGGEAIPEIIGNRCNGCGECRPVCPAGAIDLIERNPEGARV
jgi:NAD-dependent dihydropyrimidine dehydrogenase PreA subunit